MIFTLDLPWGFKHPDVQYWKNYKTFVYQGNLLPRELQPYRSQDFTYQRWQEDEINGIVMPPEKGNAKYNLHNHQVEDAKLIFKSYKNDHRGFLLANKTGTGKGLASSTIIPTPNGFTTMGELKVGDTIYGDNGETTKIIEKYRSKAKKFYEITFNDGTIIHADSDHRWLTEKHTFNTDNDNQHQNTDKKTYKNKYHHNLLMFLQDKQIDKLAVTLEDCLSIVKNNNYLFYSGIFSKCMVMGYYQGKKLYHPQEVLEYIEREEKYDLSEIRTTQDFFNDRKSIDNDQNIYLIMNSDPVPGSHDKKLLQKIKNVDINDSEIVSDLIIDCLTLSVNGRLRLLKKIMDHYADIKILGEKTVVMYTSHCQRLFDNVRILLSSFGWSNYILHDVDNVFTLCFIPTKNVFNDLDKREFLDIILKDNNSVVLRSQNRHIFSIREIAKTEEYYCISVDNRNHLYLCSENYIPTHNTLSGLSGITAIAKSEGFGVKNKGKLLVVCPKSVIPQWQQTLHNYPISTALLRPMVINYQQLNKLLQTPASGRVAKKKSTKNRQTARNGVPTIDWDYIVFDESHYLKNYNKSAMSLAASNVAQLEKKYTKGKTPFVIFSTATPGSTPLNMSIMAGILAPLISQKDYAKNVTPAGWGDFLMKENFAVSKSKSGYSWISVPSMKQDLPLSEKRKYELRVQEIKAQQRKDSQRIGKALIRSDSPFVMRSPKDIQGWPEQQIIPFPIELTTKQYPIYMEAWTRFRNWLRMTPAKSDPKGALVERLRYRQKSSLLKVDSVVDFIEDQINSDNQIYVSCEFMETIDRLSESLRKKGISCVEYSGRNVADREKERIKFQKGHAKVIISSVVAGVSFHANEILPDGTKASSVPRITIILDIKDNNLDTEQSLGRAHRSGENSVAYLPYLKKTVDETVIESFINKQANMKSMVGATGEEADYLEKMFRYAASKSDTPNRFS